jgi:AbrB family looped-hinge helix DNA binding protein
MRVTTKGQVTIPLRLRDKAGIVPGCEVEFSEEKGRIYVRKIADSGPGKALVKQMAGRGTVKMSTDEILALTRGHA